MSDLTGIAGKIGEVPASDFHDRRPISRRSPDPATGPIAVAAARLLGAIEGIGRVDHLDAIVRRILDEPAAELVRRLNDAGYSIGLPA